MAALEVLRVFVDEDGAWGNPLGVFLGSGEVPFEARAQAASELGFSETVFVEDRAAGRIRIHTPEVELPFAGHPCVGAAWLLAKLGTPVDALRVPAGEVAVRLDGEVAYVIARPEWAPEFEYRHLSSPAELLALRGPPDGARNVYAWAWIDEPSGMIRARSFVPGAGIPEDEATGSAALALCGRLSRPLTIHQGRGSVLRCRPAVKDGWLEVGGAVRRVDTREFDLDRR